MLLAKNSFSVKIDGNYFRIKLDGDLLPLSYRFNKKIELADVFQKKERIQSFKLSYALNYANIIDLRFILVLFIIFWFTLWVYLTPCQLMSIHLIFDWTSPNFKFLNQVISNTYQSKVYITHPTCYLKYKLNSNIKQSRKSKEHLEKGWTKT